MKRRLLLGVAFCCAPLLLAASQWQELYRFEEGIVAYVDPASRVADGDIVSLHTLINWHLPQEDEDGQSYRSTLMYTAYDCADRSEMKEKFLSARDYEKPMGEGREINVRDDETVWYAVSPDSMEAALWQIACMPKARP